MTRPRRHVQELPEYCAPNTRVLDDYDARCADAREVCPACDGSGWVPTGEMGYYAETGYYEMHRRCERCNGTCEVLSEDGEMSDDTCEVPSEEA